MKYDRIIVWFSCGITSAVAAKLASEEYPKHCLQIVYCAGTESDEHIDNKRFIRDVEKWIGHDIIKLYNKRYQDIYDVFNKSGYMVGIYGAKCTLELKKRVRIQYQKEGDCHIFGMTAIEEKRIIRFETNEPELNLRWILKEYNITKQKCFEIVNKAKIELPALYKMGYKNNNCIGCVKGGSGYWNKIRKDFPDIFIRMAKQERKMNIAINKKYINKKRIRVFLDELDPNAGWYPDEDDLECGVLCAAK